jgi:ATP-binding cassette subfamily F protein 3
MLSGGERARVRLAQLLLDKPNVLVLDEPTNHLDIASREALEGALAGFDGTIFCVSHDRYFLDKVARRLLILKPPGLVDFPGNYTAWQQKLRAEQEAQAEKDERAKQSAKSAPSPPFSRDPQGSASSDKKKKDNPYLRPFGRLSIEELEQQITDTEIAISECQEHFADPDAFKDPAGAQKLHKELEELSKKLEQLEAEYYAREE